MTPCELAAAITAAAVSIANCMPNDEIVVAAAAFSQLGDTLATIAAQRDFCSGRDNASKICTQDIPVLDDSPAEP